jgi:hypothetical protein
VVCCKVHKETCTIAIAQVMSGNFKDEVDDKAASVVSISLADKISSSQRLQSFLSSSSSSSSSSSFSSSSYLLSHLPVLLARIDRHDPLSTSDSSSSQLAKDLDRKERIVEVLKEAIETDPKVAELYQILLEENIL